MTRAVVLAIALSTACSACSDDAPATDGPSPDAHVDATVDAAQCTGPQEFTGELIDFDSSPLDFHGVVDAVFTMRGEPGCTATTAPNGRFILSIPVAPVVFDVAAPGDYLAGIWPVEGSGSPGTDFSGRAFAEADLTALGITRDPARAQILLFQDAATPVALTVSGAQDTTFTTSDGTTWAAGNDQAYILFTNVDIGSGVVTIGDVTANTVPIGEPRVEAGKVTYLTTRPIVE